MARKLFPSLENETPEMFNIDDQPVELDMLETSEEVSDILADSDAINQAEEVADVIEQIETAETPEQAVEIAIEHLVRSIGYNKKYSQESFKVNLEARLVVTQEGVPGRFGNAIKRTFTSNRKLIAKLNAAISALKEKGSGTETLKDPSWSKYIAVKDKEVVTGAEVIKLVETIYNKINGSATIKAVTELAEELNQLKILKEGRLSEKEYSDFTKRAAKLSSEVKDLIKNIDIRYSNSDTDNYPDFQPLTIADATKLSKFIKTDLIIKDSLNSILKEVDLDEGYIYGNGIIILIINLIKIYKKLTESKESKMYKVLSKDIMDMASELFNTITFYERMTYAIVRYIEASVAK